MKYIKQLFLIIMLAVVAVPAGAHDFSKKQTVFVIDKSTGLTSLPLTFSTILFGYALASPFFMTRFASSALAPA